MKKNKQDLPEIKDYIDTPAMGHIFRNAGYETVLINNGIDMIPTMCDLAGIETPEKLKGKSFNPLSNEINEFVVSETVGGRKAVCPGLSSFETVQNFHGFEFLASEKACNGNLKGNPLHEEALSVAKAIGVDFSVNVILNKNRNVIKAFAGSIDSAHLAACDFVTGCACPTVTEAADVVLTSSGGYPLDASFYQCVKGMVSCLPAIKTGGTIISFGGCSEGIGSSHYSETMSKYEGNWKRFLENIKGGLFIKDQWQYQMHCRTLEKIGQENLLFITDGLKQDALNNLSVNGSSVNNVQEKVQALVNKFVADGKKIAVFPEGPYCGPVSRTSQYEQLAGVM